MKRFWTALAVLGLLAAALLASLRDGVRQPVTSPSVRPRPIRLASRQVDTSALPVPSDPPSAALSRRGTCAYAVQSATAVSGAVRALAASSGARVLGYLPQDALLVEATPSVVRALMDTGRFTAAFAYLPTDKVQRGLTDGWVTVVPLAEADRPVLEAYVTDQGGTVRRGGPSRCGSFRAEVSSDLLAGLAARGDVRWLERYVPSRLSNDCAVKDTGVRDVWNGHGLTGRGQVIASADSGLDTGNVETLHADLAGRVVALVNLGGYTTADYGGHGTHTAGTLAGNGAMSDGLYRGVAYEAGLFIQTCGDAKGSRYIYFDLAETYDDIFAAGLSAGACIHSDSWGGDSAGEYTDFCIGLDDTVWRHPELTVVVACGNAGSGAQTVGEPAAAKNAVTVGNVYSSRSTTSAGSINFSSSRGPCADGRIKPDIAAPGTSIVSVRSTRSSTTKYSANENYTKMTGTSMATPHVAGCAALVRQWLVERRGYTNELPTAALIKAVLTGGAQGARPDNKIGWGRVAMEETLYPVGRAVRLVDRVPASTGMEAVYGLTLTNAAPLDVQLCWIDCPGDPSAAQTLVNDLDLVVSNRQTGVVWTGNDVAGGDRTNNTECVRIASAPVGDYSVIVLGVSVPYDTKEGGAAALYMRGAFDETPSAGTVSVTIGAEGADGLSLSLSPAIGRVEGLEMGSVLVLSNDGWAYQTNELGNAVSRYPVRGFRGTGSVPSAGTTNSVRVVLTEDSSLVWQYEATASDHALRFYTSNDEYGIELTDRRWAPAGERVTVAIPDGLPYGESYFHGATLFPLYRLGEVSMAETDGSDVVCYDEKYRMAKSLVFDMTNGVDILAHYVSEEERTDETLPKWWYLRYLNGSYVNGLIDKPTSLSGGDPDGDGFDNAAEYAADTDPVDDTSFQFQVSAFTPTNLTFYGSVKGKMVVERCDRLNGPWKGVVTNQPPRKSTQTTLPLSTQNGTNGYYRVIYLEN